MAARLSRRRRVRGGRNKENQGGKKRHALVITFPTAGWRTTEGSSYRIYSNFRPRPKIQWLSASRNYSHICKNQIKSRLDHAYHTYRYTIIPLRRLPVLVDVLLSLALVALEITWDHKSASIPTFKEIDTHPALVVAYHR